MRCANCGTETDAPIMVVYADEAFEGKQQAPFPVDEACFARDERVTIAEWTPVEGTEDLVRVEREILRYRRVDA